MSEPAPANRPRPQLGEISWNELSTAVTPPIETPVDPDDGSISLRVCLGTTIMTGGKAEQLCLDQLVTMDQSVGDPVKVFLDGELCARGTLVTLNGHFGIRITDLEEPATPASQ